MDLIEPEQRILRRLLAQVARGIDREALLREVARAAGQGCGADFSGVLLRGEKEDELELVSVYGARIPLVRRRVPVERSLTKRGRRGLRQGVS